MTISVAIQSFTPSQGDEGTTVTVQTSPIKPKDPTEFLFFGGKFGTSPITSA